MDATPERWLPVLGWEDAYEVSDQGRVRSLERRVAFGKGNRLIKPRVIRHHVNRLSGTYCVTLSMNNYQKVRPIHLLVLEAFVGPRPESMEGCHWNDDPADNRLENLRWDTHTANMYDRVRNGGDFNALKTHCPKRHEYTLENTKIGVRGRRVCRECHRADGRARYEARKADNMSKQSCA